MLSSAGAGPQPQGGNRPPRSGFLCPRHRGLSQAGAEWGTRTACPKQLGGREQVLGLEGAWAPKVCWYGEDSDSTLLIID